MSSFGKQYDGQFDSLLDTIERLRSDKFSHLGAALVRDLLRLHADASAADAELTRGVEEIVERRLAEEK